MRSIDSTSNDFAIAFSSSLDGRGNLPVSANHARREIHLSRENTPSTNKKYPSGLRTRCTSDNADNHVGSSK